MSKPPPFFIHVKKYLTFVGPFLSDYEEEDEFCPHCDNQYVIDALTPEASIGIETEDVRVDNR